MPKFQVSDVLNGALLTAIINRCRPDLKKKADLWVNTIPEKMNDMIEQFEKWGLGTNQKVGWAVGYKSSKDQSGTFVFYNRTESEVLDIIKNAVPTPDKIPVKGLALEKMVARRIVILHETIKGIYETEERFASFRNNASLGGSTIHYPPLTKDLKLGEILTKQAFIDLVKDCAAFPQHVNWSNRKEFDEVQAFIDHPNLDDVTVARGYAAAAVMLVTKE